MKTFTDAQRRATALGWAASGLDQGSYAQQQGISPRTLRSWIVRYASRQPPLEQARAIVSDAIERLQTVLDGLDAPGGMPDGDSVDEAMEDVVEPSSIGMPGGSDGEPEVEEPSQPTTIVRPSAGATCPPAPPPAPVPRPRPVAAPEVPPVAPMTRRRSFFADV